MNNILARITAQIEQEKNSKKTAWKSYRMSNDDILKINELAIKLKVNKSEAVRFAITDVLKQLQDNK